MTIVGSRSAARCSRSTSIQSSSKKQSSPVDLVVRGHLKGGERVAVSNATPAGELAFTVPKRRLEIGVWIRGELAIHRSVMDTLVIEPDEQRVLCTWKTTFACPRKFLYIDLIRIREVAP